MYNIEKSYLGQTKIDNLDLNVMTTPWFVCQQKILGLNLRQCNNNLVRWNTSDPREDESKRLPLLAT